MTIVQGPRHNARAPKVPAGPGSCDCHAHILGPQEEFPYVANRSFTAPDAGCGDYLKMLGTLGIERAVIVQPSVYGTDNRRTAAAVREIGLHRARGVAMIAGSADSAELRQLDGSGIRATRFITLVNGGPSIEELPVVSRKIAPLGWHIEMYVPYDHWEGLLPIVEALPVPVVFDHLGGLPANANLSDPAPRAIMRLLEAGKCWVKLCGYRNSLAGHPYADVGRLARFFIENVPDRCVWGSDWPHTNVAGHMPDDGDLFDLLGDWASDAAVRQKILVTNPAVLYRFG